MTLMGYALPLFSILIPTTGRADLVRSALRSVTGQTYRGQVEIVVVDTELSDAVPSMLRQFADSRMTGLVYAKVPAGDPSLGWDFAYKKSRGAYVLWLDDDNFLLPWALELFARIIEEERADVVTAQHIYFYDDVHPIHSRRGTLSIESSLLDGSRRFLSPVAVTKALFQMDKGKRATIYNRFNTHPAATVVSREVCERVRALTGGNVGIPHLRCNHPINLMAFGLSRVIVGVGAITAIVGRFGVSYSQNHQLADKANKRPSYQFRRSPVSGDIYVNHVVESYLLAKEALSPHLDYLNMSMRGFLTTYARQLVEATSGAALVRSWWRECISFAKTLEASEAERILPELYSLRSVWRFVWLLKKIGLWSAIKPFVVIRKTLRRTLISSFSHLVQRIGFGVISGRPAPQTGQVLQSGVGRSFSLKPYDISSIEEAAARLGEVLLCEAGIDIVRIVSWAEREKAVFVKDGEESGSAILF